MADTTPLEGVPGQIAWTADALEGARRDVNEQNTRATFRASLSENHSQ